MSRTEEMIQALRTPETQAHLADLYGSRGDEVAKQTERYEQLIRRFEATFGDAEGAMVFSAPGRTEIGGNHTDHNNGRVLAASVNLDTLCVASPREDTLVRFHSEGYSPITLDLKDLDPVPEENGTTAALIRGVADGMAKAGYKIGGFNAVVTSTVAGGSGLSSSAALEVMLTGVLDGLFNDFAMPFAERATISKRAENVYFGKPSGLLDQMASAAGGLVTVDFQDETNPLVRALQFDFAKRGFALVVVATGGSHADLTDQYAAIPKEMMQIASFFGQKTLRGVTENALLNAMQDLRSRASDRAIMRAFHFTQENERVVKQVAALDADDMESFLSLITESGRSSFMYLQNVYAGNDDQSLSLALCMAEAMLKGKGAWRVHGGGFAGTTLNFVPLDMVEDFTKEMDLAFGQGASHVLNIRPVGADMMPLDTL